MPPVACSGWGRDGWQMLFRSPSTPLEPAEHRLIRLPMSPIPGTWHTPPGKAGVTLSVSVAVLAGVGAADAGAIGAAVAVSDADGAAAPAAVPAARGDAWAVPPSISRPASTAPMTSTTRSQARWRGIDIGWLLMTAPGRLHAVHRITDAGG